MQARTLPVINSNRYCSQSEGNIPADSPSNRTETVSLVTLSFLHDTLLFFVDIFFNTITSFCLISGLNKTQTVRNE